MSPCHYLSCGATIKIRSWCVSELYLEAGNRLEHILETIGFDMGRGHIRRFYELLRLSNSPELRDLKFRTVRAWFQQNAPAMRKIDIVIDLLHKKYNFHYDQSLVKTWWKLGGYYPFSEHEGISAGPNGQISDALLKKIDFIVMASITQFLDVNSSDLSVDDLIYVRDQITGFACDFSSQDIVECPSEYLTIMIRHFVELRRKSNTLDKLKRSASSG